MGLLKRRRSGLTISPSSSFQEEVDFVTAPLLRDHFLEAADISEVLVDLATHLYRFHEVGRPGVDGRTLATIGKEPIIRSSTPGYCDDEMRVVLERKSPNEDAFRLSGGWGIEPASGFSSHLGVRELQPDC